MDRINVDVATEETQRLLADLAAIASQKFENATNMPPNLCRDPGIAHLEHEKIWKQDWVCPGLAADIPKSGDYLSYSIADEAIYCIRDDKGEIRTYSNVCRHRMMQLVEGRGNSQRIICPYHAWTYDLKGKLVVAGQMRESSVFDKTKICLPEFRTEIWNGFIYVTLNNDAASVEQLLTPLADQVARYEMQNYIPVVTQDHTWNSNWKLLTENFMEGYHLPVAHKETVGAWIGLKDTVFPDKVHESFTYQTFTKADGAAYGIAHPDNTILKNEWRNTSVMPTVFPSHMYVCAPDHMWYLSLRPKGIGQINVRFGASLAPELYCSLDNREEAIKDLIEFFDKVNDEDRQLVEGIFKGSKSEYATPGPLSWLEREIHDFEQYLANRLCR
ncbi:MAG: SRPBCC family protein [Granulosicoccaceae bacterium]